MWSRRGWLRQDVTNYLLGRKFRAIQSCQWLSTTATSVSSFHSNQTSQPAIHDQASTNDNPYYDDASDEVLVANADNLPRSARDGFAIIHHFEFGGHADDFNTLVKSQRLPAKDIARLHLTPSNVTLPIALMIMDPEKFETVSRARKFCRHGRIVVHRGVLGVDPATGKRTVFTPQNTIMGKVGDRVFPGDVIGRQVAIGSGHFSTRKRKAPPFDLPVVFQDDHFAIVNKPAGVVIYSSKNSDHGLLTVKAALPHVLDPPAKGTISALKRPKAVHRLDKPTSGLLLIGKTLPAMDHLSSQFRKRKIQKTYTAVVNGIPVEDFIASISSQRAYELGVDVDPECDSCWHLIDSPLDEKDAVTIWRPLRYAPSTLARDGKLTLVEIKPKTGRYHQIRRHMAWVCERALVGDKEYDGNHEKAVKLREQGLFLCSNRVRLEHPFYNSQAGRAVWNALDDSAKVFEGGRLWYCHLTDSVMVTASVDIPKKFYSFLDFSQAMHERSGTPSEDNDIVESQRIDIVESQ